MSSPLRESIHHPEGLGKNAHVCRRVRSVSYLLLGLVGSAPTFAPHLDQTTQMKRVKGYRHLGGFEFGGGNDGRAIGTGVVGDEVKNLLHWGLLGVAHLVLPGLFVPFPLGWGSYDLSILESIDIRVI